MRHCTNEYMQNYRKTTKGFLCCLYNNMKRRIKYDKYYRGKAILPREAFYKFELNEPDFIRLFSLYIKTNNSTCVPSINRIDSAKGYELGNMNFVTRAENSKLSNIVPHVISHPKGETNWKNKIKLFQAKQIRYLHSLGVTYKELAKIFSVYKGTIGRICRKGSWAEC